MLAPDDRRYSEDHQWILGAGSADAEGAMRVGITDFAQDALGEVSAIRFGPIGARIGAGAELGEIEAFKAMSDIYMPVSATLVGLNPLLEQDPTLVNTDPYGRGWMCRVVPDDPSDVAVLFDAPSYRAFVGETGTTGVIGEGGN